MGFWNYRVVLHVYDNDEQLMHIHRAHYEDGDDPAGRPRAISQDAISVHGEDVDVLRRELERITQALDKPVLPYDQF